MGVWAKAHKIFTTVDVFPASAPDGLTPCLEIIRKEEQEMLEEKFSYFLVSVH